MRERATLSYLRKSTKKIGRRDGGGGGLEEGEILYFGYNFLPSARWTLNEKLAQHVCFGGLCTRDVAIVVTFIIPVLLYNIITSAWWSVTKRRRVVNILLIDLNNLTYPSIPCTCTLIPAWRASLHSIAKNDQHQASQKCTCPQSKKLNKKMNQTG